MRLQYYFLFILISGLAFGQTQLAKVDFETANSGYSASMDGEDPGDPKDYFKRTQTVNNADKPNGDNYTFASGMGSYYWGMQDSNEFGEETVTTDQFSISGYTDLTFKVLLASGSSSGLWETDEHVDFAYKLNGGDWTQIVDFSGNNGLSGSAPTEVSGGSGRTVNETFSEFSYSLGITGSTLQIRLRVNNQLSASEDLGVDNMIVEGTVAASSPTISTSDASSITSSSASLGGNITADGGAAVTERGVVYSSSDNTPEIGESGVTKDTNGSGTGSFTETIGSLSSGTKYYFQAYAINSAGTSYGGVKNFTTLVNINFVNGANASLDFNQTDAVSLPQNNWLCGQFSLSGDATGATLNSVIVSLAGSYDPSDLQATPFQLYASNTNDFSGASALGSSTADPGSGHDITFSTLNDAIPSGVRYYWVTADLSATATGDDTMNGTVDVVGDLNISNATISGSSNYGKLNAGDDASLPVTLTSFSAKQMGSKAIIEWRTESEVDHLGFILEKKVAGSTADWQRLSDYLTNQSLAGKGNSSENRTYTIIDAAIQTNLTYLYRLMNVDKTGQINQLDIISLEIGAAPQETILEPPFPNPFNPSTKISFKIAEDTKVSILVYNLLGKKVCSIMTDETCMAGNHFKYWNGKDDHGMKVSTGTYIIQLVAGSTVRVQKAILTR